MAKNGVTWQYTYDANGMRTQRTNGSSTYKYVYNGSRLSQMTVGNNTLSFSYDATGAPVVVVWNGTPYYYVTTLQGDVLIIMDLEGELVVSYEYDAWGNILSTTGSLASTLGTLNPLRYRGYVYDQETGLYYLQSRYYNPTWGRFLNADAFVSTGQGLLGNNMFAYCLNNPANMADPSGAYAKIWGELFRDHDPGYIHWAVQAHIIATGLFKKELILPGVGRADIWDPDTFEIWEIKYGGSTADMQNQRTQDALNQVNRYVTNYTGKPLRIGHAGAFTGSFLINSGNVTYAVTYETPQPGVILYYVEQSKEYDSSVLRVYLPAEDKVKQSLSSLVALGFVLACAGGISSLDPLCQKANTN